MASLRSNRRVFLTRSVAALSALGAGSLWTRLLLADPVQLAARLDEVPDSHPLLPALRLAHESILALKDVKDYTCAFTKRERFGRKLVDTQMELKLREEPFSVYLKFVKPHAGREVVYQQGANNNFLQAHDTGLAGLAGTISLDPTGSYAMDENRHPVTLIGMKLLAVTMMEQWLGEISKRGAVVKALPESKVGEFTCKGMEASYAAPQTGLLFHISRLQVDVKTGYPVRAQQFDFPARRETEAPLAEEYLYSQIRINQNLADLDFSVKNPKYGF